MKRCKTCHVEIDSGCEKNLCNNCEKNARMKAREAELARRAKNQAFRDMGITRIKGTLGIGYWE